jgi:hypothetical protein
MRSAGASYIGASRSTFARLIYRDLG